MLSMTNLSASLNLAMKMTTLRTMSSSAVSSKLIDRARWHQKIKNNNDEASKVYPTGRFVLYHKNKPLLYEKRDGTRPPRLATYEAAKEINPNLHHESVFMHVSENYADVGDDAPIFAATVPDSADADLLEKKLDGRFVEIRDALFHVNQQSRWTGILSGGSSMLRWHREALYCMSCSAPLERNVSGSHMRCTNTDCHRGYHPPIAPFGIVLIATADHSRALLLRQQKYPPGMYSCIAGYFDAGENLADCVVREAAEGAGIHVDPRSVRFLDSNHWPFPDGSLMIGCVATTETEEPSPCEQKVEEARWFTPQELADALDTSDRNPPELRFMQDNDSNRVFVPPRGAIGNHIIRTWLKIYAKVD